MDNAESYTDRAENQSVTYKKTGRFYTNLLLTLAFLYGCCLCGFSLGFINIPIEDFAHMQHCCPWQMVPFVLGLLLATIWLFHVKRKSRTDSKEVPITLPVIQPSQSPLVPIEEPDVVASHSSSTENVLGPIIIPKEPLDENTLQDFTFISPACIDNATTEHGMVTDLDVQIQSEEFLEEKKSPQCWSTGQAAAGNECDEEEETPKTDHDVAPHPSTDLVSPSKESQPGLTSKETMTCSYHSADASVNTHISVCRVVRNSSTTTSGNFMKKFRRAQRLQREARLKAAAEMKKKLAEWKSSMVRYRDRLLKLTMDIEKKDQLVGFTLSNRKLSENEAKSICDVIRSSSSKLENQKKVNKKLQEDIEEKTNVIASFCESGT